MTGTRRINREFTTEVPVDKLLAYYPMDDGEGGLRDVHSNMHLAENGSPTYGATGILSNCVTFDGSTDFFQTQFAAADITDDYPLSFSAWIKSTDETLDTVVCLSDLDTSYYHMIGSTTGAEARAGSRNSGSQYNSNSSDLTIDDGSWHHVVGVFASSTNRRVWVDGVAYPVETTSLTYTTTIDAITIGALNYSSGETGFWNGQIDEVSIWTAALTPAQIKWLYNGGNGREYANLIKLNPLRTNNPGKSDLLFYLPMDDASEVKDAHAGNDFTPTSTTLVGGVRSKAALSFDGSVSYAEADTNVVYSSDIITWTGWVKMDDTGSGYQMIYETGTPFYNEAGAFYIARNGVYLYAGVAQYASGIKVREERYNHPGLDTWFHLAVVLDNSTATGDIKMFYDGVEQTEASISTNSKDASGTFGTYANKIGRRSASTMMFPGDLSDIAIWERELTEKEIQFLHNGGRGISHDDLDIPTVTHPPDYRDNLTDGLVAFYQFGGSEAESCRNRVDGHSFKLTENNSPTYGADYVEVDDKATPNQLLSPAGLIHSSPLFLSDSNAEGTLLCGFTPTVDTGNGDYPFQASDNWIRYIVGGWRLNLGSVEHSSSSVPTDADQVVGGTHKGGTTTLFVDGARVGDSSGTFAVQTTVAKFGIDNVASSDAVFRLYWFAIWNRKLSDKEIAQLDNPRLRIEDLRAMDYILEDDFSGTGNENGWIKAGAGTVDYDYTGANKPSGAAECAEIGSDVYRFYQTLGDDNLMPSGTVKFMWRCGTPSANTTSFQLLDEDSTNLFYTIHRTDDTLDIRCPNNEGYVTLPSTATWAYVWVYWAAGATASTFTLKVCINETGVFDGWDFDKSTLTPSGTKLGKHIRWNFQSADTDYLSKIYATKGYDTEPFGW